MTKRRRALWRLALLTLLAAGWGCGMPPSRPEFADRMARSNHKLMLLAVRFRTTIQPIAKPEGPDVDEAINVPARSLYKEIETTVSQLRADYARASLPAKASA